jgi:hypothetical protein
MSVIAPRLYYNTLDASREIEASGGLTVFGFILSNGDGTNARTVTFADADGNTYIQIYLAAGTNFESVLCWRPGNGLTVSLDVDDADVTLTLFRSSTLT